MCHYSGRVVITIRIIIKIRIIIIIIHSGSEEAPTQTFMHIFTNY